MKMLRTKKNWISDFKNAEALNDDTEILYEFFKEGEGSPEQVQKRFDEALTAIEALEFRNMLSEEGDHLSAVLQITAGAGGTES